MPRAVHYSTYVQAAEIANSFILLFVTLTEVGDWFDNGFNDVSIFEVDTAIMFLACYFALVWLIGYDFSTIYGEHLLENF